MLTVPLKLVFVHWIADFVFQNDFMALGKSQRWKPLLLHTAIYGACLIPFGIWFALVNFVLHTITDYFTSRLNKRLLTLTPDSHHYFFVGVGFDQFVHYATLAITWRWLIG